MAKKIDRIQPTLYEYPIQNMRTGWHPVWTPTILVVPWSFDINKNRIINSQIKNATFAIEDMIAIKVAGHPQSYMPLGVKPSASPDRILFKITLTYDQLLQYKIDTSSLVFYDDNNDVVDIPVEGNNFEYVNYRGIVDKIKYFPDAEYFDLSAVEIAVDDLPVGRYIATWTIEYNERIQSGSGDYLYCISDKVITDRLEYPVNHPGEIHNEMVKLTPALYFTDVSKKKDTLVNLYRPFADILQDIFDESDLSYGINWVKKIPPQLFPYLAHLINVELPIQLDVKHIDIVRKRMIERGAELQKLKGSKLAIKELFSILGFGIEIINLWVNVDGNRFVAPNELTDDDKHILSVVVSHTDPLVANYDKSGFLDVEVPLLYHNKDNHIVVNAYIVKKDSNAHLALINSINKLIDDSNYFATENIINHPDGYLALPSELQNVGDGLQSHSRLVFSDIELLSEKHVGRPVINFDNIKYDPLRDKLNMTFAGYKDLASSVVYIFATYRRDKIIIPPALKNNISNRFDIKITSEVEGGIESSLYDYLIDSLFKYKAFHSLLRKVSYDNNLRDFYNVTDFCITTYLSQLDQSDNNSLMVPPACSLAECIKTSECNEQNARGGLRKTDRNVSNTIIEGLKEEYERWHEVTIKWLDIANDKHDEIEKAKTLSNIQINIPINEGDNFGQDRVSFDFLVRSNDMIVDGATFSMLYMGDHFKGMTETAPNILTIIPIVGQLVLDLINVPVVVNVIRRIDNDVYYIKTLFNIDAEKDIRSKIVKLDKLFTPDYCYKGRARDFLSLECTLQLKTTIRNRPCHLMMGSGIYYVIDDINDPLKWHKNDINKLNQSLHFNNRLFLDQLYTGSRHKLNLNIEKSNYGFPGHRPIYGGLLNDFTHPTYKARPWDINDKCFEMINPLNAKLIIEEEVDGTMNERLIFDETDLIYKSSIIKPDIETYSGTSINKFTHAIYSTVPSSPYVDLGNIITSTNTQIETAVPIFDTAKECTTMYTDYIDGYPALDGPISFHAEDIWSKKTIDGNIVVSPDIGPGIFEVSATYSSQRMVTIDDGGFEYNKWRGYRYDCDCAEYLCNGDRSCNYVFFKDHHNKYDFNNDHVEVDTAASFIEKVGANDVNYNGLITGWLNWKFEEDKPTEFKFKDEYGTIYNVVCEFGIGELDIQYETFQPYVWGEPDDGYVEGKKIYRRGILTIVRQIFKLNNHEWLLMAEGHDQKIIYAQTNYDCDNIMPNDRFVYHFDNCVQDNVSMLVSNGSGWIDPTDDVTKCYWGNNITGGTPFEFINVWDSYDVDKKYVKCVGVVNK